jgi:hypothetical protein
MPTRLAAGPAASPGPGQRSGRTCSRVASGWYSSRTLSRPSCAG